ncbi:CheY-like chemotaxis protein [Rhodopirellula rubra]|uniref:CheY-like chemotaxis protein n=1 Tax=Aporhodopirellula rubra TaxID=980271 RepID=A0A7W5DTU7_9BACT|nr:response regulator [Aporhodopirellula rubra]MBB3204449.1 CheY-like chemotaxis protein [Aporhodopirellula rubra]
MKKPIQLVMLIDDSSLDNMIHTRILKKSGLVENIIAFEYADEALEHLRKEDHGVDVIFLDLNMPRMDGYEFLERYHALTQLQRAKSLVMMLSTSSRPGDAERAKEFPQVIDYQSKPLELETIEKIARTYFGGDC